ncbi:hypothetical protein KIF59_11705 [Enterobacter cloacae subsp. cloacae]|nr:hypothetical protein [Enterobacter cloacae subsp. cloacae]
MPLALRYRRLDEDNNLAERLNKSLGSYYDSGRFRCPDQFGLNALEIMVHEGIHQGLQDHMWLHYFKNFAEKNFEANGYVTDEETFRNGRHRFIIFFYRLISIATDWAEQCALIDDSEIPEATRR